MYTIATVCYRDGMDPLTDPDWLPRALVDLDAMRASALAKVDGADEPAPDNREARECIRLSAELRGLLGAAAKAKAAHPPPTPGAKPWEDMTAAEQLAEVEKARGEVLARLAAEKATGGGSDSEPGPARH